MSKVGRINKDRYYLEIAKAVALRSPCVRARYGAIIVKHDAIVSTGYNGPVRGGINCYEVGECIKDILNLPHGKAYDLCPAVHAEENCVSGDTLIMNADGSIEEARKINSRLLTIDLDSLKESNLEAVKIPSKKDKMLRIKMRGGVELTISPDHILFIMDDKEYLKEVYAKDVKVGDYLPHLSKIDISGKPQKLPQPEYPYYKLKINNWQTILGIFKSKGYTWRRICEECGFSLPVISNLKKGRMIRRRNMKCLLKLFPELERYIEGVSVKKETIPSETNEGICQIIGYFIGDGNVSGGYIAFHDINIETLKYYNNLIKEVFGVEGIIKQDWKKSHYILYLISKRIQEFFENLDLGTGDEKTIPKIIQVSDNKCIKGLIKGLFDAEASVGDRSIHFTSSSKKLIDILRLLLLRMGIFASIYRINRKSGFKRRHYYSLEINGDDVIKYAENIGFSHPLKKTKLNMVIRNNKLRYSTLRVYPISWFKKLGIPTTISSALKDSKKKYVTYPQAKKFIESVIEKYGLTDNIRRLRDIIEKFIFLKVIEIEEIRKSEEMYDFYAPPNHNFIANGILVHNCIINAARNGASVLGGTLYLHGVDPKTGKTIYSEPCDRCKRAIINAGIARVVTIDEKGNVIEFDVKKWIEEDTKKYLENYRLAKEGKLKI